MKKRIKIEGLPDFYQMREIMIAYLNGKEMEEDNMPSQHKKHLKEIKKN